MLYFLNFEANWITILVNTIELCICSRLGDEFVTWSCEPNTRKWHRLILNSLGGISVDAGVMVMTLMMLYFFCFLCSVVVVGKKKASRKTYSAQ